MQRLFLWILLYAVFMYLITPIIIRFTQKMSAAPKFGPVDLSTLPAPAAQFLGNCQQALESEGFEMVGHLSWQNSAPNLFPLLSLFMNRKTQVKAVAAAIYVVTPQGAKLTTSYVEFITRYQDETVLGTSNTAMLGTYKHGPKQKSLRMPGLQSPTELYEIHRRRMAQIGGAIEPLPAIGTEIAVQEQRMIEDFEEQVQFGRLYLDRTSNLYRPTWKGAYLMTWSQLQPMKNIRNSQDHRKSAASLKELEASATGLRV